MKWLIMKQLSLFLLLILITITESQISSFHCVRDAPFCNGEATCDLDPADPVGTGTCGTCDGATGYFGGVGCGVQFGDPPCPSAEIMGPDSIPPGTQIITGSTTQTTPVTENDPLIIPIDNRTMTVTFAQDVNVGSFLVSHIKKAQTYSLFLYNNGVPVESYTDLLTNTVQRFPDGTVVDTIVMEVTGFTGTFEDKVIPLTTLQVTQCVTGDQPADPTLIWSGCSPVDLLKKLKHGGDQILGGIKILPPGLPARNTAPTDKDKLELPDGNKTFKIILPRNAPVTKLKIKDKDRTGINDFDITFFKDGVLVLSVPGVDPEPEYLFPNNILADEIVFVANPATGESTIKKIELFGCVHSAVTTCTDAQSTAACDADGTYECLIDASNPTPVKCLCKPGYSGTDCGTSINTVACEASGFVITWYVTPAFNGNVYPYYNEPTGCVTGPDANKVYKILFSSPTETNNCGVTTTINGGTTTHEVTVVFQYGTKKEYYDDLITATCVDGTGTLSNKTLYDVRYDTLNKVEPPPFVAKPVVWGSTAWHGTLNADFNDYTPVNSDDSLPFGSIMRHTATLDSTGAYSGGRLRMDKCILSIPAFNAELDLIVNGCINHEEGVPTILKNIKRTNESSVSMYMVVFLPTPQYEFDINCEETVCSSGSLGDCDDYICDHPFGNVVNNGDGRRRRDAPLSSVHASGVGYSSVHVSVRPFSAAYVHTDQRATPDCWTMRDWTLIVGLLCGILLILGVICFFLTLRYFRKKSGEEERFDRKTPWPYQASEGKNEKSSVNGVRNMIDRKL